MSDPTQGLPGQDLDLRSSSDVVGSFDSEVLEFVDVSPESVDRSLFLLVDLATAQRSRAIVISEDTLSVTVALADPTDLLAMDDLRLRFGGRRVRFVTTDPEVVEAVLARWQREVAQEAESAAARTIVEESVAEAADAEDDGPMAELVNRMLEQAMVQGASDIHIEPTDDHVVVRFRVDGVLIAHNKYPLSISQGVINRLKVLSKINLAERRTPQDGRLNRVVGGREVDVRVVTLPMASGREGAVMRLFDQSRARMTLEEAGFHEQVLAPLRSVLSIPHGMLLVTGPTGSGKTSTLYASLGTVARPDRKVVTIEDPVEIRFPGVSQMQVNEAAGLTFATALRSFLRADPDVMLVGEIRDSETAALAAQAALTGHVVLSTLHTNEAAGAVTRLVNLGLDSFIIASALRGVLAQRLVRRLCSACAEPYVPAAAELAAARWPSERIEVPSRLYRASSTGCPSCAHIGYRGRAVVGELLLATPAVVGAIIDRAPTAEIERIARTEGAVSLHDDAVRWVADGVTSLSELSRAGV